jgi:hypothetical protein
MPYGDHDTERHQHKEGWISFGKSIDALAIDYLGAAFDSPLWLSRDLNIDVQQWISTYFPLVEKTLGIVLFLNPLKSSCLYCTVKIR